MEPNHPQPTPQQWETLLNTLHQTKLLITKRFTDTAIKAGGATTQNDEEVYNFSISALREAETKIKQARKYMTVNFGHVSDIDDDDLEPHNFDKEFGIVCSDGFTHCDDEVEEDDFDEDLFGDVILNFKRNK